MSEVEVVPGQVWLEMGAGMAGDLWYVQSAGREADERVFANCARLWVNPSGQGVTSDDWRVEVNRLTGRCTLIHDPRWPTDGLVMKPAPSVEPAQPEKSEAEELLALLDERVNCVKMSVAKDALMVLSYERLFPGDHQSKPSDFLRALRTLRVGG